ncbi:DUF7716 domain-containing protein [Shewanella woodyi]|uniref:DUF7716 domain-containing protein n=1 Tax=Shewanella woodyi (strain ATCC 51908 / MS32) TaxID=392500 RepID=B1KFF8_SHEWM|nr:hypothetical protein [Shewanella woodyi]ACA88133.1 conserved hypothetical protein [Shewanella woodyi ATCC 51908]
MEPLINILNRARVGLEEGWLYLPENSDWTVNTLGIIIDADSLEQHEVDEEDEPIFAKERRLIPTIDSATIESVAACAENLDDDFSEELLLESFVYYVEYDAFLPYSGFKPLPPEGHRNKLDRDFYDSLGEERPNTPCKREDCSRGAVKYSVLCRVHHFEMIHKRPCPFSD